MIGAIFDGLMSFVMGIFKVVLEVVMKYVVAPVLQVLFQLVIYVLSMFMYSIATFFLGLIDFVEVLFRLLAGLPTDKATLTIGDGGFEGSSDLLLQVILSDAVKDVFLSMCIVGLFLLVITTIFKIIQVEYTTEGSKNAKGPILTKAFKGLCNMILLPVLVIFGVFLGNQVLDLLDKATSQDSGNATIAGVLFATSASDAFYKKSDLKIVLPEVDLLKGGILSVITNLIPIVINTFQDLWDTGNGMGDEVPSLYSEAQQDEIVNLFMQNKTSSYVRGENEDQDSYEDTKEFLDDIWQQSSSSLTHNYYTPAAVTSYFNIGKINYIVLFFGGVFVLKCLYYSCFGLVTRLYQCAMLFIISPAVIGMTPVMEGNLGKWRSKFIGSCLSAYGVVVAMNLFFILIEIFLNLNLNFTSVIGPFGNNLLEGILKTIFVLAGCLMIEKFSKEIGSYFGADDALSIGKETEKGVMDQATKGIKVAAGIGGRVAAGGASAIALGSKIASGARAGKAANGGMKGMIGGAVKGAFGVKQKVNEKTSAAIGEAKERNERLHKNRASLAISEKHQEEMNALQSRVDNGETLSADEQKKLTRLQSGASARTEKIERLKHQVRQDENHEHDDEKLIKRGQKIDSYNSKFAKHDGIKGLASDTYKGAKSSIHATGESVRNRAIRFGTVLDSAKHDMFNMVAPKPVKDIKDWYGKMAKDAGNYSDEAKAVNTAIDEGYKDRRKESIENGLTKALIDARNKEQEQKMVKVIIENATLSNLNLKNEAQSALSKMTQYRYDMEHGKSDQEKALGQQRLFALQQSLASKGITEGEHYKMDVNGEFKFTAADGSNIGISPKKLQDAFKDVLKKHGSMNEDAQKELIQSVLKDATDSQARELQKIIEKTMSQLNGAK